MKYFDDDMDELFNKAGRDYPLKTDPPNWDAVRGALYPGEVTAPKAKSGWRRYLPLLLLLLIPLGVYLFVEREGASGSSAEKDRQENKTKNENVLSGQPKSSENVPGLSVKKNALPGQAANKTVSSNQPQPENSSSIPDVSITKNFTAKKTGNENIVSHHVNNKKSTADFFLTNTLSDEDLLQWNKFPPYGTFQKPEINIPVKQQIEKTPSVPNAKKKKPSNKKGFYYGITAAPDISRIKGQEVKGTGYSAGIIAGYQLNAHWSVEVGLLWSRKKYFTDGKYFSKEGAQIPSTVDITWLNGGCNMFEFPLLARYDLSVKKNTFFATAGLISYMMKKEDYKYGAWAGPGPWYYEGERKYDRSGDHLFSNLQLSAGYKFSLSPKMNIRIEPYLKAPLKKIGIGKMPVTSAGLLFGITRDFR